MLIFVNLFVFLSAQDNPQSPKNPAKSGAARIQPSPYLLSKAQLSALLQGISQKEVSALQTFQDLLDLLNNKKIETWYFGSRELSKIPFPAQEGTAQSKIISALKVQFFDICRVHNILCFIDAGIHLFAKNRDQLALLRARTCKTDKIYRWAISVIRDANLKNAAQREFKNLIVKLARQTTGIEFYKLFLVYRKYSALQMRQNIKRIASYFYPDPQFNQLISRSRDAKLKSDLQLLKEIFALQLDAKAIQQALNSPDSAKKKAAKLLYEIQKYKTGKYRIILEGKMWWALITKYAKQPAKLKALIEKFKPSKLDNKTLGGFITAYLLLHAGINAPNDELTKYFFDLLKYFDFTDGSAELLAYAFKAYKQKSDKLRLLLPYFVKNQIYEAIPYILPLASAGDDTAIDALTKFELAKTAIPQIISAYKQNRADKNWRRLLIYIAGKYRIYEVIDELLKIYDTGATREKAEVLKSCAHLATMKTVRLLIANLKASEKELAKTAADSLKNLFFANFQHFSADFKSWKKFWDSYQYLPGYKKID